MGQAVHPNRIFVVDDERMVREVVARMLERRGYEVEAFEAPRAALERLEDVCPALIVSDLRMPDMSGVDLLEAVRERCGAELPAFLLMTAFGELESARRALRAGAYDYVAKPFELRDLQRIIERGVERVHLTLARKHLTELIAEDLMAPLGAVRMSLEALERGSLGPLSAEQREMVTLTREECGRLHRLARNLEDVRLLERGELYHRPEPFQLQSAVEETLARFEAEGGAATTLSSAAGAGGVCEGDRDLFGRVLENLLVAAARAASPPIRVEVALEGERAQVRVGPIPALPELCTRAVAASPIEALAARTELRRRGVDLNAELELSFAAAAARILGGRLELLPAEGGLRAVLDLPCVVGAAEPETCS